MSRNRRDLDLHELHQRLRTVTGRVVLTLAAISFAVSAVALTSLGMDHGLPWWLAWTLPIVLDGLAISGGLMVFSRTLDGDPTKYGWFLIILGTTASVAGNVLHAGDTMPPEATDSAVLVAQVIAGGFPAAMLAAFEGFLLEQKRTAKASPLPDAPTLDATVAQHLQEVLPTLVEPLQARLEAVDAERAQLAQQLQDSAASTAEVVSKVDTLGRQLEAASARQLDTREVDTRVDASTRHQIAGMRQQLEATVRQTVTEQVSGVRVHLDQQAASTRQHLDTQVDTTVRTQLRQALPELSKEIANGLRQDLEDRAQQRVSTSVQQQPTHRELQGSTPGGAEVRGVIVQTYHTDPNPASWSKRSLARAAGYPRSTTVAQSVLDAARRGELDARPDASPPSVQEVSA